MIEHRLNWSLSGKLRPNLNKVYSAEQASICSTDILAFRFKDFNLAKFYAHYFLIKTFNGEVCKKSKSPFHHLPSSSN